MATNPTNPLFYAGTFVSNNAAGLVPPSRASMATLVDSMQAACFGPTFQADRCAILSQQVGRLRTQDACARSRVTQGDIITQPLVSGLAATGESAATAAVPSTSEIVSALASIGSGSSTSLGAIC